MKTITFITILFASVLFFSACQNSADTVKITDNLSISSTNTQANSVEPSNKKFESLTEKAKIANEEATRLEPSNFKELPEEIIKNLEIRGCKIPQTWHLKTSHNVISGEFSKKGQKDWAVLCSINQISSILIFWSASTRNVAEIAKSEDSNYIQGIDGNNKMGFSRAINTVDKKYIIDHYNSYGGAKPPNIDHEGINDAFVEKASGILYLHRGKWLELQGAD